MTREDTIYSILGWVGKGFEGERRTRWNHALTSNPRGMSQPGFPTRRVYGININSAAAVMIAVISAHPDWILAHIVMYGKRGNGEQSSIFHVSRLPQFAQKRSAMIAAVTNNMIATIAIVRSSKSDFRAKSDVVPLGGVDRGISHKFGGVWVVGFMFIT